MDLRAPTVAISPADGAVGVPTNAVIQLGFDQRIDPLTVTRVTFQLSPVAGLLVGGSYLVAADGRSATLVPGAALAASTTYRVVVAGVADLEGQQANTETSFTTASGARLAAPTVTTVSPQSLLLLWFAMRL